YYNISMRYIAGILVAIVAVVVQPMSSSALSTMPTNVPLMEAAFVVSGYSFHGHTLRYVQIANTSNAVARMDGWKVAIDWPGGTKIVTELQGSVAPQRKVVIADSRAVQGATMVFEDTPPLIEDARVSAIRLLAPAASGINDVLVTVAINDSL